MRFKRILLITVLLLAVFAIGSVSASENVTDNVVSVEDDAGLSADNPDNLKVNSSDEAIGQANENESVMSSTDEDVLAVDSSSEVLGATSAYVKGVTAKWGASKYVYLGWNGYFSGYFKVYKGSTRVHSEYLSGYDNDRQWSTSNLKVGTYTAKLVNDNGRVIAKSTIVIKKSAVKVSVRSFVTYAGYTFYCYAYVKDRYDGANYDGGYVYFKINGKYYRARLNDGVAILKFRIPSRPGTYYCVAAYGGNSQFYGGSKVFKMVVKKSDLLTFKGKSKYTWKIKKSVWQKMKRQAVSSYVWLHKRGSSLPGYSSGVKVTLTKGGYWYSGTAFAVKSYRGIRCEVRGLYGVRPSTWGDYYI